MIASVSGTVYALIILGIILNCSTADDKICMDGFTKANASCYSTNDTGKGSWSEAQDYCLSKGAHLPYIKDMEESGYLLDSLTSQWQEGDLLWLGLKVEEGAVQSALKWQDGSAVMNWNSFAVFSPDHKNRCTALRRDMKWELQDCDDPNHRICETELEILAETTVEQTTHITDEATETTITASAEDLTPRPATTANLHLVTTGALLNTEIVDIVDGAPAECKTLDCLKELIEADPANEEQLTEVVEVSTEMLERDPDEPTGTPQDEADRVTEIIEFLDETFSLVLSSLDRNKTILSVFSRNIVFEAKTFSGQCGEISANSGQGKNNDILLCTESDQGGHIGVGIACIPDSNILFPLGPETKELDSRLGSCVVTLNAVEEGITPSMVERMTNATMAIAKTEVDGINERPICAFWRKGINESNGSWSDDGCQVVGSNVSHVICSCNHLTNFAVLVRIMPSKEPLSDAHTKILDALSIVGGVISIACLGITLVLYIWLKVYRSQTLVIHANLAVSILVSQVIFLTGIDATGNKAACKLVAALLHYSLLASFAWMMLEGANLYLKATNIFQTTIHVGLLFGLGWASPLPIVGISLGVKFSTYTSDNRCWLNNENGLIWAFVTPVIVVILCNTCVLLNVIRVFLSLEAMADKPKAKRIKAGARAVCLLTPLLGITWLIGLFNVGVAEVVVSYIFVILNSSQGVFIFVLHCALNEEVGKALQLKRDKHNKLHSSKVHPNTCPTSKSGADSLRRKSGKKNVAWACSPATDKSCVISGSTEK